MADSDFIIPDSLKDALIAGDVIPFIGAGVSRAVENEDQDIVKVFKPLCLSLKVEEVY